MNLKPIQLGRGRVAHIPEEISYGEYEDITWLQKHWSNAGPEHTHDLRDGVCLVMIGVQRWEGMPDWWNWPDLQLPLSSDQPAIKERFETLQKLGMGAFSTLAKACGEAVGITQKLEGN